MSNITKEDWVLQFVRRYPGANEEVLNFIADINFRYDDNYQTDTIRDFFCNGYCYYFAKMLQDHFGGLLKWIYKVSHIIWYDQKSQMCYDMDGICVDYSDEELMDINCLSSYELAGFTKNERLLKELGDVLETDELTYTISYVLYENKIITLNGKGCVERRYLPYNDVPDIRYDIAKAITLI